MRAADLIDEIQAITEVSSRPKNPAVPKAGFRSSYLITFDYGVGNTDGMLDTLRVAGYHAFTKERFPCSSVVCRTAASIPENTVLGMVAGALENNGSAFVVPIGGDGLYVWPDAPSEQGKPKKWKKIEA